MMLLLLRLTDFGVTELVLVGAAVLAVRRRGGDLARGGCDSGVIGRGRLGERLAARRRPVHLPVRRLETALLFSKLLERKTNGRDMC